MITAAHARFGPIVRLGPSEISICSLEGAKRVYVEKGGFGKPKWWAEMFASYGVVNMTSMQGGTGDKMHATRKRDMGNVYAKSFVLANQRLKDSARIALKSLQDVLEDIYEKQDGVLSVYNFNGGAHADIASAYIYGPGGTNFIGDLTSRNTYYHNHETWAKGKPGAAKAQAWLEDFGNKRRFEAGSDSSRPEMVCSDAIVHKQLASRGLHGDDLASEMLDHFMAGAEAPRTTLTYLEWRLSKQPGLQNSLREELRLLNSDDLTSDLKALDGLPLLEAVLVETLRLYTPTPGPMHRVTPPGGTTIDGIYIPGGVAISAALSVLHSNPRVFPEPLEWKPERWLVSYPAKVEEMRKWFWAFNKGSRICIGKDFSLIGKLQDLRLYVYIEKLENQNLLRIVMKLIIANIYTRFETEIVEHGDMKQEDRFLAGPAGGRLVLRFRKV